MVHDCQLDCYGRRVATCSSDRTVKIFDFAGEQATPVADLRGHDGPVWQVSWAHPKFGQILASCSFDHRVIVWKEVAEGQWTQVGMLTTAPSNSRLETFDRQVDTHLTPALTARRSIRRQAHYTPHPSTASHGRRMSWGYSWRPLHRMAASPLWSTNHLTAHLHPQRCALGVALWQHTACTCMHYWGRADPLLIDSRKRDH
jgi:hypothetical protein